MRRAHASRQHLSILAPATHTAQDPKAPVNTEPLVLEEDDEFAEFEGAAQMQDGGCGGPGGKAKAAELDEFQADWDDQEVDTDFMNQLREQLAQGGK